MDYLERYSFWKNSDIFDKATRDELVKIKDDDKEIKERFYKDLEFGTGGIRGILGAGENRMNIYTIRKATQGLANYIVKKGEACIKKGVAIAFDSRRMSPEFANETALVLAGNGIKAYIFESLRPTPELSFAVRELGCTAGVVVTASHNPPEYNGYKVYWEDGAQIAEPIDKEVIDEVNNVSGYDVVKVLDKETAIKKGLYVVIGEEIDKKFISNVLDQIVNKNIIEEMSEKLSIIYTPIHGSGSKPVQRALKEAGFKNVHVVKEQEEPDENFSTVGYPNPEDPKVFNLAVKLGNEIGADIIIGTDPDCDRVGAVVKDKDGQYVVLTGNMTGFLLTEYILSQKKERNELPTNAAVISTIVSTDMTKAITKNYDVKFFETLTGFKYIGEKIKEFEIDNSYKFQFGFEESYGCLAGTYARDKDAVVASTLLCEMAAYYKKRNMTLLDGVYELYEKYGCYKDDLVSITLQGIEGIETMDHILKNIRSGNISEINGVKVSETRDYESGIKKFPLENKEENMNMPKSNVLFFTLEDETWFCVRPSGTEPKIKIYIGVKEKNLELATKKMKFVIDSVLELIENAKK